MDKLIIDDKDYGNDYAAYCKAYNNKLRDMFMEDLEMKQLNEIPTRQPKRPKIKRYRINDFGTDWSLIFAYVLTFLLGTMLFIGGFIALILT